MAHPESLTESGNDIPEAYRTLVNAKEPGVSATALMTVSKEGLVKMLSVTHEASLIDNDLIMARAVLIHCAAKFEMLPEVRALLEKADRCCQRAQGIIDGVDHLSTTLN